MTASPDVGVDRASVRDDPADSDASVVERSCDEPELFAVLFDRHSDDIHRYAARRLGTEAADDLMAETFVIAFQQRRRYDLTRPHALPWLYGIVTNLISRHKRAEARRLRALARVMSSTPAEGAGVGDAHSEAMADRVVARVGAESTRGALAAALAGLSPRNRDVLLLIAWGDLDYAEAAEALGIPVGTVRSRLHRARSAVRAALGGADPTTIREDEDQEETHRG
ncbi:RNA polymerase sigma factor [Streptomyces sp. NPDC050738]|uniref:RNA polymerase sigma factor n=1 Tax=Streptomyces sp. NPDC050738 TaxID=3154744 RepID=UPI00341E47A3